MHSIRTRLFLVFSAMGMVLVLLSATLYQISFERSLVNYLQERGHQRMLEVSERLADTYHNYNGWPTEHTAQHPRGLRGVLRLPRHFVVLNEEGGTLYGEALPHRPQRAVPIMLQQQQVGTLLYHPMEAQLTDSTDRAFRQQQWRSLALTTAAALIVALLGSWLLARQMVRPVRAMAALTEQMARGNYRQRFTTERRDELGLLSDSINQLAHHLEQAAQARDRWLADTAHELRTPLAILQGEIEALVDGIRHPSTEHLLSLQQEVNHLKHLVDDLHDLALADVGSLRYRMEKVDLSALLHEQAHLFAHHFAEQGLAFTVAVPEGKMVLGDATRLRQLLTNLLSNSLNYTEAPGRVQLTMTVEKKHLVVLLEDSAPGVAEDKIPLLFEHLFRSETASRNRQFGGSGLGLALAKRIALAHGAELTATPSPLGGLAFTLRFKEVL
ncbi:MAG TPA: ATP-binding protein [Alcanivoracaceae bacterium]|nr:ATP-binding protein [Alcanivoracaceae bacterium]